MQSSTCSGNCFVHGGLLNGLTTREADPIAQNPTLMSWMCEQACAIMLGGGRCPRPRIAEYSNMKIEVCTVDEKNSFKSNGQAPYHWQK
eukprot:469943-Amphidinium_carterae.1